MENNYGGDLTDIIRGNGSSSATWDNNFQIPNPINDNSPRIDQEDDQSTNNMSMIFGDPFCNLSYPLLDELNVASSGYLNTTKAITTTARVEFDGNNNTSNNFCGASISSISSTSRVKNLVFDYDQEMLQKSTNSNTSTSSCNIYSRIQMLDEKSKLPFSARDNSSALVDHAHSTSIHGCNLIENNTLPSQILSPRNIGIKRRKSQAKKVVCIPAPAAPNSRPSGEAIPSDLWAWRKYGQKPIKGSPYPRGYYRCSSSKGCGARKQVERSRNDPNMLVITYTSEHNHPWPTQRNALAGSTRPQHPQKKTLTSTKKNTNINNSKEEALGEDDHEIIATTNVKLEKNHVTSDQEGLNIMTQVNMTSTSELLCDQDFFGELGEIEADPLELLSIKADMEDPFGAFDWSYQDHTYNSNASPF